MTLVLQAKGLSKKFGPFTAVDNASLEVNEGDIICIIGRSGSGKSTFLRCLNGLERPDSGLVYLDDAILGYKWRSGRLSPLSPRAEAKQRSRIGMVFQQFNLFPYMTAVENIIEAPVHVLKRDKKSQIAFARELMDRVGLSQQYDAFPSQLSGGQQQRVAIARAMAMKPRLILFDEPTSALDPELVEDVLGVMVTLANEGTTMIVVTHEMRFARKVATRVAFVHKGAIVEEGPTNQILDDPRTELLKGFLGKVK